MQHADQILKRQLQQLQVAQTFLLSSWFVLLIALYPPVLDRLVKLARPRWNPIEVGSNALPRA